MKDLCCIRTFKQVKLHSDEFLSVDDENTEVLNAATELPVGGNWVDRWSQREKRAEIKKNTEEYR